MLNSTIIDYPRPALSSDPDSQPGEIHDSREGDFACGQRTDDGHTLNLGDFATGMFGASMSRAIGDFATGMRTASIPRAIGDFATGMRTARMPTANGDSAVGMRAVGTAVLRGYDSASGSRSLRIAA